MRHDAERDRLARRLELKKRLVGGEGLAPFIARVSPHLSPPAHLGPLIKAFERARRRRAGDPPVRVCISLPPRHAKTTLVQHAFAWWLREMPGDTCAYASYSDRQAWSKSRRAREIALGAGVRLSADATSLAEWRTPNGGGLLAVGAGGGLTGQGVSGLMVVDDPFKNREEADSKVTRDKIHEWMNEVVMTRLEGAAVFVVHTRWHPDDLIGRLAGQENTDWELINLPALAEEADPMGRPFGEALWPERYPRAYLEKLRKTLGAFSFDALYQGRPRPRGAKVFGPAHYYDPATTDMEGCESIIGADPAASERTTADYSAAVAMRLMGRDPSTRKAYIREVYREQVTVPQFCNDLRAFQARHDEAEAAVEGPGPGKAVVQTLKAVDPHIRVKESPTKGDKFQRAQGFAAAWNDGRVLVPLGSPPWLKDYLEELSEFTGVRDAHEDQVDASSHGWNAADNIPEFVPTPARIREKFKRRI
jgi:predicted phage terminase large subunit-like protein